MGARIRLSESVLGVVLLGFLGALFSGCAGLPTSELPDQLIAVRYLMPEQERRERERAMESRERSGQRSAPRNADRRGVADFDDLTRLLGLDRGHSSATASSGGRRGPGRDSPRLAFLDPRSLEVEIFASALPGSYPVAWDVDHTHLLFGQFVDGYRQLFEYDVRSEDVRRVTSEPGAHPWGCYGPDGRIVVESVRRLDKRRISRIEIAEPGGHRFTPLTDGPDDLRPACSPRGDAIAYVRGPWGMKAQIAVRSPVVEGPVRLLGAGVDPSFSPDGRSLFYTSARRVRTQNGLEERWRLRRALVTGLRRGGFEKGPLNEFEPAISPDGRFVAYVGVDADLKHLLYVRRVDGSDERILFLDGAALGPIW
ncbi:hypothetical protein MK489_10625 [Myxococcota bacterium]|nr:hypothetical protein [Myxococcota bacterium]